MDVRLESVRGCCRSRAGKIAASWQIRDGSAALEVDTPVPAGKYQQAL